MDSSSNLDEIETELTKGGMSTERAETLVNQLSTDCLSTEGDILSTKRNLRTEQHIIELLGILKTRARSAIRIVVYENDIEESSNNIRQMESRIQGLNSDKEKLLDLMSELETFRSRKLPHMLLEHEHKMWSFMYQWERPILMEIQRVSYIIIYSIQKNKPILATWFKQDSDITKNLHNLYIFIDRYAREHDSGIYEVYPYYVLFVLQMFQNPEENVKKFNAGEIYKQLQDGNIPKFGLPNALLSALL